jgi:hypothetical protein
MTLEEFEQLISKYKNCKNDYLNNGYYWVVRNIVSLNIKHVQPEEDQAFLILKYSEYLNDAR